MSRMETGVVAEDSEDVPREIEEETEATAVVNDCDDAPDVGISRPESATTAAAVVDRDKDAKAARICITAVSSRCRVDSNSLSNAAARICNSPCAGRALMRALTKD